MGYTNQLHPFFPLFFYFRAFVNIPRSNPNLENPSHPPPPFNTVFFPTPFLPPSTFPRFVSQCQHLPIFYVLSILWISANNRSEGSLGTWGMLKLWSRPVRFEKKRKKGKERKEKKRKSDSLILFIPPLHSIHLTSPLFVT